MNIQGTAFEIIAKVNKLKYIKDNIFTDENNEKYYLDKFGFHNSIIYNNHHVNELTKKYNNKLKHLNQEPEFIGKKRKTKILNIISMYDDKESIELIQQYLNK